MELTSSVTHALILYCEVHCDENVHEEVEQHNCDPNMPRARIFANVASTSDGGSKGVATPSPRAITLPQVRITDAPHGDPEIRSSSSIMHTVPCASLLHPARAPWVTSQGSKPSGTTSRDRKQSVPVRAQQASQEPYPFVASACCSRACTKGLQVVWPFALATNSVMNVMNRACGSVSIREVNDGDSTTGGNLRPMTLPNMRLRPGHSGTLEIKSFA